MNYLGGKNRQSKIIAPIVNQCIKENHITNYYEPFCGGLNVLDKIQCNNLYANDIDNELIAFYEYIKQGGAPLEDLTKTEYYEIKASDDVIKKGNIKYMGSFGGKPWGGYGWRTDSNKSKYRAALPAFKKQIPIICQTSFTSQDYRDLIFKPQSFIYCDAPYANTTSYGQKFNYKDYYEWLQEISKTNFVIVSEYQMPDNFVCFKEITHLKSVDCNSRTHVKDKLFYCEGLFEGWIKQN